MPKLFGWLPKRRWLRWTVIGVGSGVLTLAALGVTGYFLLQQPAVQSRLMGWYFGRELHKPLPEPPAPSLADVDEARLARAASALQDATQLYAITNVWDVHLHLTESEWIGLGPKQIPSVSAFSKPDGTITLRNPKASRAGLAGVLGIDMPWSRGTLAFGDRTLTNVAIRFKGNGTFLSGMSSYKRPFKLDLNKYAPGQQLAGRATLNLGNLLAENSMLTDALGYEFYRAAGVRTLRTAFARTLLSIDGRFTRRNLGLYLLVENPDAAWARDNFGIDGVAVFKPVTQDLFLDLGDAWPAYQEIYDPKTPVSTNQQQHLIAFAKFFTKSDDAEFAARVGEFVDLERAATFFACEITLANYDGIFTTGQNYLLCLDPRSNRFSFGPWDLDHSWGEFPFLGSATDREQASIWKPWTGKNRFLERLYAVPRFRELYRAELERLQATLFQPERLSRRVDELAAAIRPFVADESTNRLAKFEQCVAATWADGPRDGNPMAPDRPAFPLKRFFAARAKSIQDQLAGRTQGVELKGMGRP